ncbi:Uncharacterised protein [Mycolicibacterium tokaiense]|uniref:Uncharacterized protein n=1 Tax=Mycolicibacterium tokaiense TaxID=39695 RepID=A0A378TNJ2_9MYCO|nr:Uncharacterised protein [Mycolicibacterium tokaiense]
MVQMCIKRSALEFGIQSWEFPGGVLRVAALVLVL